MVPPLQPASLVRRGQPARLACHLVAQEEVEGLLEELHAEEAAHLDAVDDLVLAEVGRAHHCCFLGLQGRPQLVVAARQPEEGVEDQWRYAAVYLRSDEEYGVCFLRSPS